MDSHCLKSVGVGPVTRLGSWKRLDMSWSRGRGERGLLGRGVSVSGLAKYKCLFIITVTADEGKPVRYEGYVILFFILSKDQVQCEKSATAFGCKPKRKSWSGCSASSGYSRR